MDDALGVFIDHNHCRGLGFSMLDTEFGGIKRFGNLLGEGSVGFEFWPVGVPGRNKALATYFLHGVLANIEHSERFLNAVKRGQSKRVQIVIDKKIADLVGLENFLTHESIDNNYTLILRGADIHV